MLSVEFDVLLLDIEGTITPMDFVYNTLFPFARCHIREFVEQNHDEHSVHEDIVDLKTQYQIDISSGLTPPTWQDEPCDPAAIEVYVHWLMDHDRKVASLKALQGKIWKSGYENGTLRGCVFEDILPAFQELQERKKAIYLFSSGSVLAQQLLITHSECGDLSQYISGYFDISMGLKREPLSYKTIARTIGVTPSNVLFISDTIIELDAAHTIGMQVLLARRHGNVEQGESSYLCIESFYPLEPLMS
tara:strand:- start:161 stop:901 length:741 start_codon:yes stop_codon:yes gene_type:complete